MTVHSNDALLALPPRPLRPDEREISAEWLARTCDVASAFVSNRQDDDPAIYRRIVIATGPGNAPSFLIHCPSGTHCWLVFRIAPQRVRRFPTLEAALNSVRPVFPHDEQQYLGRSRSMSRRSKRDGRGS